MMLKPFPICGVSLRDGQEKILGPHGVIGRRIAEIVDDLQSHAKLEEGLRYLFGYVGRYSIETTQYPAPHIPQVPRRLFFVGNHLRKIVH